MKSKTLGLLCFGIIFVALFLSLTSATITFNSVPNLSPYENSYSFVITSTENQTVNIDVDPIIDTTNANTINFESSIANLSEGIAEAITINYSTENFDFEFGETYSTTLRITDSNSTEYTTNLDFQPIDFCGECENKGELNLDIEDVNVLNGFGDEDDFWYLFDEIEIELEIENDGEWDVEDIEIEWALYTTDGQKIMDDTLKDFDLDEGEDETVVFTFKLDEDIDDFENQDAILYVKAKGKIDDNDSPYDEEETCDSDSIEVEVIEDDDFIIVDNPKINGIKLNKFLLDENTISCNQEIAFNANLQNIGEDDQEDVIVLIYSKELELSEEIEIGDIDGFKDKDLRFSFTLPNDLEEKWYYFDVKIYDEDKDLFENDEDDESSFRIMFEVKGECNLIVAPTINAELISEAKENSELIINIFIQNNDDKAINYTLNAAGYADWASLNEISQGTINLGPRETKQVVLKFQTNKESAGDKFFDIELLSENELVAKQSVVISIEESRASNFVKFIKDNWKLLGIGLLNLILIIAIIIVAARTYRK